MISRILAIATVLLTMDMITARLVTAECQDPVNPDSTDPSVGNLVVGTWYSETPNPQLGMVQQMYQTFLPTGVFEYRDQTCGSIPGVPCSQNYGHGFWMAAIQSNGIYIRVQFSDLNRTNECTGWLVNFPNPNMMVSPNGGTAYRVQ